MRRLRRDARGAALIEFALALPVILTLGGYGVELSSLFTTHMRVSQIALTLADNASRIGVNNGQAVFQLREGDLNDILKGAQLLGTGIRLTTLGRVTVSSLENVQRTFADNSTDSQPVQRIHWQRCIGLMKDAGYDSSYGTATPLTTAGIDTSRGNAGTVAAGGMGTAPAVNAPSGGGVIFVEVNYQYQPVFGTMFVNKSIIHYSASFIVRDKRDFSQIFNPQTALGTTPPRSTCDLHAA